MSASCTSLMFQYLCMLYPSDTQNRNRVFASLLSIRAEVFPFLDLQQQGEINQIIHGYNEADIALFGEACNRYLGILTVENVADIIRWMFTLYEHIDESLETDLEPLIRQVHAATEELCKTLAINKQVDSTDEFLAVVCRHETRRLPGRFVLYNNILLREKLQEHLAKTKKGLLRDVFNLVSQIQDKQGKRETSRSMPGLFSILAAWKHVHFLFRTNTLTEGKHQPIGLDRLTSAFAWLFPCFQMAVDKMNIESKEMIEQLGFNMVDKKCTVKLRDVLIASDERSWLSFVDPVSLVFNIWQYAALLFPLLFYFTDLLKHLGEVLQPLIQEFLLLLTLIQVGVLQIMKLAYRLFKTRRGLIANTKEVLRRELEREGKQLNQISDYMANWFMDKYVDCFLAYFRKNRLHHRVKAFHVSGMAVQSLSPQSPNS